MEEEGEVINIFSLKQNIEEAQSKLKKISIALTFI